MSQFSPVVCITLFLGTMGCAIEQGDEPGTGPAEEGDGDMDVEVALRRKPAPAPTPTPAPTDDSGSLAVDAPRFIDACSLPGSVNVRAQFRATGSFDAHDEGVTDVLNLPFSFKVYGKTYSQYWITTNGQLGFGATRGGSAFGQVTCPLADARIKTPVVFVYSADLIGRLDGNAGVCYATTGISPRRKLVVTWKDSFYYDAWLTSHVTFSATLNEGSNYIDVAIARVDAPTLPSLEDGNSAVVGRQSGGSAQAYSCQQPLAPGGTIVRFNP
jgi:hypothetical protein